MNILLLLRGFLFLGGLLIAPGVKADGLRLITEELPPLSYSENGRVTGFSTEVVREIMGRTRMQTTIEIQPWMHAYKTALEHPNVGLFSTTRTEGRESLFQWVGPISNIVDGFYVKKGEGIKFKSLAEAKGMESILVLRGSYTHQLLEKLGFKNLYAGTTPEEIVRMILAGRSRIMVTSSMTVRRTLAKIGAPEDSLDQVLVLARSQTYIAFSKGTSPQIVHLWQKTLDDMKKDGSFNMLYSKWFPSDIPPGVRPDKNMSR